MGRCPTGIVPGGFPRGRRKRGLQTDLQNEIVQEIETLLGRQSIADFGFRSHRNGGTPPDFALGSACPGTTAQHRHQRSCGTASALSLWGFRAVSWPSRKDLRKRTGAFAPTTRLLSL